ncbi:MAG: hypothetical protein ACK4N5_01355 [Myxococcales bacterium]
MAERAGHQIVLLDKLPGSCRAISSPNDPLLMVLEHPYQPKIMHRIAHELVELELRATGTWTRHELEEGAQYGGAALILPPNEFLGTVYEENFDVAALRRRWPFASYELIVSRIADLLQHAAGASWTNRALKFRHLRHDAAMPPGGELLEQVALEKAQRHGRADLRFGGVRAAAWLLNPRGQSRAVSLCLAA